MEQDPEYDISPKIAFIGDSGTGTKTCFIDSYVRDTFSDPNRSTIGVDFLTKSVVVRGKKVKLQIWDIGGQERCMPLERAYYRGAAGIVVGYDITNKDSFETAKRRYINLKKDYPDAVIMVIGNKVDLVNDEDRDREVSYEEGDELANEVGASLFFETSVKTGLNVNESMDAFIEEILASKGMLGENEEEKGDWVFIP